MEAMITHTTAKNALVLSTSPVRSSIARSFMKMMRACSAQVIGRGTPSPERREVPLVTGSGLGLGAMADMNDILIREAAFGDPFRGPLWQSLAPASEHHERTTH